MRHYKSEYTFQKYKPYESSWRRFLRSRNKRKKSQFAPSGEDNSYRSNPFKLHDRRKKSSTGMKFILFFILLATWAVLLLYLPFFRITKISINGLNNLSKDDIQKFLNDNYIKPGNLLPYNDYFLTDTDKIKQGIDEKFALQSLEVVKTFPNQLDINIIEKTPTLIYDNGQKYYLIDSGGTAIKYLTEVDSREFIAVTSTVAATNKAATDTIGYIAEATTASTTSSTPTSTLEHIPDYKKIQKLYGNYPLLYDRRGLDVYVKQTGILPVDLISSVTDWNTGLSGQGIAPKYFILDNMNSGITIDTADSWNILFKPGDDPPTQINILKNLLKTIHPINYVDLRFGDRVYWK